jgi:cyclopropane fatty-acyl-phospholipid synthase-like methyltransferase
VLDVGCGGGWALVQIAERFPRTSCVGVDVEPSSVELAQRLIQEWGLADRCQARAQSVDQLGEEGAYDVDTRTALQERCRQAGFEVAEETTVSRFTITVAQKA